MEAILVINAKYLYKETKPTTLLKAFQCLFDETKDSEKAKVLLNDHTVIKIMTRKYVLNIKLLWFTDAPVRNWVYRISNPEDLTVRETTKLWSIVEKHINNLPISENTDKWLDKNATIITTYHNKMYYAVLIKKTID